VLRPSLDELMARVDSKYALVVAAAKRARALMAGDVPLVETQATKAVTVALEEIAQGELDIVVPPVSIK
jgi:DNA-directed RNA polymerase subunit omega